MWKLPQPPVSLDDTYAACISRIRSEQLRERLKNVLPAVEEAAEEYEARGGTAELHLIPPEALVDGDVTTEEMCDIYDSRMAKSSGPGRPYYDQIKSLAKNEICPLCGHRQVKTLDHVLPKKRFPVFAVTPINLIPACSDCNKSKGADVAANPEDVFLHPYFDNVEDKLWLHASIQEERPAVAQFYVEAPQDWPAVLRARIENHFRRLDLARLYSHEAAQEMSSIRSSLQSLSDAGGASLVRQHMQREKDSRIQAQINSWRSALYTALFENDWYVEGGFQMPQ